MDWKSNLVSLLVGAVIVGSGCALAWTPWLATEQLQAAIAGGDQKELTRLIDHGALGANLKRAISAELGASTAGEQPASASAGDASASAVFVESVVDALTRPEGLAMMLEGDVPKPRGAAVETPVDPAPRTAAASRTSMRYDDMNHFRISVQRNAGDTQPIVLLLTRQDSVSWKLTDIHLPRFAAATPQDLEAAIARKRNGDQPPGISQFDGDCVDTRVAEFRAANGENAEPTPEMLTGWMTGCQG